MSLFLNGFSQKGDDMAKYTRGNTELILTEEEAEMVNNIKYTTLLNMSQIDLFNKNYKKAVSRATESLKIRETAKGFFRRGCARLELGDLDEAESDHKRAKELEPENSLIDEKLLVLKKKLKELDSKLKEKYKNMFSGDS